MSEFIMPEEEFHASKLLKIDFLKGSNLSGQDEIKNLQPDRIVKDEHILHSTARGFYVPKESDYLLSYQATEKSSNYGEQIIWDDKSEGSFKQINMKPPSSSKDPLKERDIEAARYTMQKKYPIGIFHNYEKGENRCLGLGVITEENQKGEFIVKPISLEEKFYSDIYNDRSFYIVNTSVEETVNNIIIEDKRTIEIEDLNWYQENIDLGDIIFLMFGGDNPDWDTGFVGVCKVIKKPYDVGYRKTKSGTEYYKLKLYIDIFFNRPLKKIDYLNYKDAIKVPNIGPEIKNTPNQAIRKLNNNHSTIISRGILDIFPDLHDDLTKVLGSEIINKAKEETVILIEKELKYGEKPEIFYTPPRKISKNNWNPNIINIKGDMKLSLEIFNNLKSFINNGKNVILMGPPGTGKTTIADRSAKEAIRNEFISSKKIVTATADWTTFDTIGGYMPQEDNQMNFTEGAVLESIRNNSWLIIDEINRADIDKAFGEMFTVLSKREVTLPYKIDNNNLKIKFTNDPVSYYDDANYTYYIGENWRIICTMNTFDKKALYEMSYALMRRFAFVNVPLPETDQYNSLIKKQAKNNEISDLVIMLKNESPVDLGPAVLKDLVDFLNSRGKDSFISGITGLILPQFEGLRSEELINFCSSISNKFKEVDYITLKHLIQEYFDIPTHKFNGDS